MEPAALAVAVTPTLVARAFELLGRLGERGERERQLLRMLYLEARLNREVLEAARLGDSRGVETTHTSFKTLPPLLETDAHVAALLAFDELQARPASKKKSAESGPLSFLRKPYPAVVSKRLDELEAEAQADGDGERPRKRKRTTPLKSIAFVCVKTAALQKLVGLPRNASKAIRQHRYGYRLEQILLHEQELLRQIARYDELEAFA
ncbi:MAG: hypothetical protein PVI30_20050 [Myxococcales bacterium]|jgi:hypothetical protein